MLILAYYEHESSVPGHAADLEVTQVRTILLFSLSGEFRREELHGVHGRSERVHVVLSKVASAKMSLQLRPWLTISVDVHPEPAILADMARDWFELPGEQFDSMVQHIQYKTSPLRLYACSHSVDFPAPLGPTTAIRESRPTSMLTPLRRILSGSYPNDTSFSWRIGGEIFSASGNLNVSVSSTSGGCSSGN